MPAFDAVFDDSQLADLAVYLRATYSKREQWTKLGDTVAKVRKENQAR